jgi:hypothetical protein
MTFRDLVTDAVERELSERNKPFVLRDASAGYDAQPGAEVSANAVNKAIDSIREEHPGS